jgi:hypothetical protein
MIRIKKLAVTGFAVLYGALIMSASLERANDWLARLAPHSASRQHSPSLGKTEKTETHLWQKKIVERAFVVESPQETVVVPIQSGSSPLLSSSDRYSAWTGQLFTNRAPPSQI